MILVALCTVSCADDSPEPSGPSPSSFFVECKIDGADYSIIHNQGTGFNGFLREGEGQYPNQGHCVDLQYTMFGTFDTDPEIDSDQNLIQIGFSISQDPIFVDTGSQTYFNCPNNSIPLTIVPQDVIIRDGENEYAGLFQDSQEYHDAPTQGIMIIYYDELGNRYTSFQADNSNGFFNITSWSSVGGGTTVSAEFDCVLIDEDGNEIVIEDGRMRGQFLL